MCIVRMPMGSWRRWGRANLRFPSSMIFLNGAPGAGKGTMARYFHSELHLSHISTSDLLQVRAGGGRLCRCRCRTLSSCAMGVQSPEAQKLKNNSMLVNDTDVIYAILNTLLSPQHKYSCRVAPPLPWAASPRAPACRAPVAHPGDPICRFGVVIDGFPRTRVQVRQGNPPLRRGLLSNGNRNGRVDRCAGGMHQAAAKQDDGSPPRVLPHRP